MLKEGAEKKPKARALFTRPFKRSSIQQALAPPFAHTKIFPARLLKDELLKVRHT